MKEKLNIIICPNCGAEYLPAEIFLPDSFLGRPGVVDKTISALRKFSFAKGLLPSPRYSAFKCFIPEHKAGSSELKV